MKRLAVILISLVTAFTGVPTAQAFPTVNIERPASASNPDIVQVRDHRWRHGGRHWRGGDRRWRHSNRYYRNRGYYRHGGYYRHHRRNHAGAIIGGLAAGAIIGGLAAQPRYYDRPVYGRRYVGGTEHERYCYARYRSYRAWDNTYQPYSGPRRQCR